MYIVSGSSAIPEDEALTLHISGWKASVMPSRRAPQVLVSQANNPSVMLEDLGLMLKGLQSFWKASSSWLEATFVWILGYFWAIVACCVGLLGFAG